MLQLKIQVKGRLSLLIDKTEGLEKTLCVNGVVTSGYQLNACLLAFCLLS